MGRPPLGKRAMTATEYQRRWRERKRLAARSAGPDSGPVLPVERAAPPDFQAKIDELARQRDQARQELELARGARFKVIWHEDDSNPCSRCRKRLGEVKVLLKVQLSDSTLFLCNSCIDDMRRTAVAAWMIGEATME